MENLSEHYYIPTAEATSRSAFYMSTIGLSIAPAGQPYPPARHPSLYHFEWKEGRILPEFGFLLITAGRGVFESRETGRMEVLAGTALLTFPGVWHRYTPDPRVGWTECWMHFNGGCPTSSSSKR